MASTNRPFASFTITQPFLGAPLQFQPALGSLELEQMIDAFVTGSSSKKDKLSEVTIDFYNHATVDLNTGALVRRYDVALPVSSPWDFDLSPTLSQSSSGFGAPIYTPSPTSSSALADSGYGSLSMTPPTRTRGARVAKKPKKETKKAAEARLPGFSIMTKDGVDVTTSAGRGTKTKEQREHAHLMRIMKACDDCKRKKIRCDPSHRRSHNEMSRTSTSTTASAAISDPSPLVSVPSLSQQNSFSQDTTPSFGTSTIDDFVLFPEDNTYWNPADMSMPDFDSQITDWNNFDFGMNGTTVNDFSSSSFNYDQSFDFSAYEQPFSSQPGYTPLVTDQSSLDQWAGSFGSQSAFQSRHSPTSYSQGCSLPDSSFYSESLQLTDSPVSPTTNISPTTIISPTSHLDHTQLQSIRSAITSRINSASDQNMETPWNVPGLLVNANQDQSSVGFANSPSDSVCHILTPASSSSSSSHANSPSADIAQILTPTSSSSRSSLANSPPDGAVQSVSISSSPSSGFANLPPDGSSQILSPYSSILNSSFINSPSDVFNETLTPASYAGDRVASSSSDCLSQVLASVSSSARLDLRSELVSNISTRDLAQVSGSTVYRTPSLASDRISDAAVLSVISQSPSDARLPSLASESFSGITNSSSIISSGEVSWSTVPGTGAVPGPHKSSSIVSETAQSLQGVPGGSTKYTVLAAMALSASLVILTNLQVTISGMLNMMPLILLSAVVFPRQFSSSINLPLVTSIIILTLSSIYGIDHLRESCSQWIGNNSFAAMTKLVLCCMMIAPPPSTLLKKTSGLHLAAALSSLLQLSPLVSGASISTHNSLLKNFREGNTLDGFFEILSDSLRVM